MQQRDGDLTGLQGATPGPHPLCPERLRARRTFGGRFLLHSALQHTVLRAQRLHGGLCGALLQAPASHAGNGCNQSAQRGRACGLQWKGEANPRHFLPVIADFLAPRSFLVRFLRSFMFFRDRCTLVSRPFCAAGSPQLRFSAPHDVI